MRASLPLAVRLGLILVALSSIVGTQIASATSKDGKPPIRLGGVFVQSGDPSAVSVPILNGYKLAFAQANATGGIKGAPIVYDTQDDNYDPSQTVAKVRTLVESDHVLAIAGLFGSDDSNAAINYLQSSHTPFFDPIGGGANVAGDSWIWQTEPSYGLEGKVMGHYLAKTMKVTKVAAVYQQGINESEIAALKKWFKPSKFMDVSYKATDTDVTIGNLVSQVRNFRPQVVILLGTLIPTADFVKLAAENGYQPPKGWFANYPQGDPTWLGLTAGCVCMNGSHVSSYADLTGKNPVAHAYAAAISRYDHGQKNTNYGLYGYFNGGLMIRALRLTAKTGPVTAKRLQAVLDTKFRKYKSGFTGILNWTPSYRYGVKQLKIYKINGSKFVPVTNWLSS